ncbi:MAG: DUF1273 family protein [Clostridia bacterium]|nr:DUF1273 family protein [Clostridia bacterium]
MLTSNLPPLTKNLTCAVTGHRVLGADFDFEKLKNNLREIALLGYSIFLTGMAQGFDLLCFKALLELKQDFPHIKVCAVVPCADQDKYLSLSEKTLYGDLIKKADYLAKEDRRYFKGCMFLRNNYLVDNCSLLFAYYNGEKRGGTYYTVKRAISHDVCVKYYGE